MLSQTTLPGFDGAISSRASRAGSTPLSSPGGPSGGPRGPALVPANRSAMPAKAKANPTLATCGPSSSGSLTSAALQSVLASKLRQKLASVGSMEYSLTWKERVTPAGRPICALRARAWKSKDGFVTAIRPVGAESSSGRPIFGNGCGGWPSPAAQNADGGPNPDGNTGEHFTLQTAAGLVGWSTPRTPNGGRTVGTLRRDNGKPRSNLETEAMGVAGWPSPMCPNMDSGNSDYSRTIDVLMGLRESKNSPLAGWVSPTAQDHSRGGLPARTHDTGIPLSQQVAFVGWATPAHRDYRYPNNESYQARSESTKGEQLNNQVVHHGPTPTSSPAETASSGVLEPAFSRWLQGYPQSSAIPGWDSLSPNWSSWATVQSLLSGSSPKLEEIGSGACAVLETASSQKSPPCLFDA